MGPKTRDKNFENFEDLSISEKFDQIGRMILDEPPDGDFAQAEIELSRLSMILGFANPDIVRHRRVIHFLRDA